MTIPEPWDSILFLSLLFFTPFAAIYLLVGKSKWFRAFCKFWSFSVVFGLIGLYVWTQITSIPDETMQSIGEGLAFTVYAGSIIGVIVLVLWMIIRFLTWLDHVIDPRWIVVIDGKTGLAKRDKNGNKILIPKYKADKMNLPVKEGYYNHDHPEDCPEDYLDGSLDYDSGYVAPIVTEVHHYHESAERPIEHKPFPERRPSAPPPPRPEPVRQPVYKVQRMDRGGYWSTKYTTNNMRIAEQQMRNYMNGAYRLQDERQPNVRWRIVDEDDRVVF